MIHVCRVDHSSGRVRDIHGGRSDDRTHCSGNHSLDRCNYDGLTRGVQTLRVVVLRLGLG